jgi:hypothetical protein
MARRIRPCACDGLLQDAVGASPLLLPGLPLNRLVVDREFLSSGDIANRHIRSVWIGFTINTQVRGVAVIDKPNIVAAEDEALQSRVTIAIV